MGSLTNRSFDRFWMWDFSGLFFYISWVMGILFCLAVFWVLVLFIYRRFVKSSNRKKHSNPLSVFINASFAEERALEDRFWRSALQMCADHGVLMGGQGVIRRYLTESRRSDTIDWDFVLNEESHQFWGKRSALDFIAGALNSCGEDIRRQSIFGLAVSVLEERKTQLNRTNRPDQNQLKAIRSWEQLVQQLTHTPV